MTSGSYSRRMATFLKGYKVNIGELKKRYGKKDGRVVLALIEMIPRDSYIDIELAVDKGCHGSEDGHYHMVIVTDKGHDEGELKKPTEATVCTEIEQAVELKLLSPGVWLNHSRGMSFCSPCSTGFSGIPLPSA